MSKFIIKGYEILLDDEDDCWMEEFTWGIQRGIYTNYLTTKVNFEDGNPPKTVNISWFVAKPPCGYVVDHVNRNGLDNRKSNLHVCKQSLNCQRAVRPSANKYTGVYKRKYNKNISYVSFATINGKYTWIGRFKTEDKAAAAYNRKVIESYGHMARLNKVCCTELWLD